MSHSGQLPRVPTSVLRDAGTDERVERVWKRLDNDLAAGSPRVLLRASAWGWAPAAMVIVFASGVFVGATWIRDEPSPEATFRAEPLQPPAGPTANPEIRRESSKEPGEADQRKPTPRIHRTPVPVRELEVPEDAVSDPSIPAPAPAPAPAPVSGAQPEWQQLFYEGEFDRAREVIEARGGFDAVMVKASPEQLMLLSLLARSSHDDARAIDALRRVVSIYPEDPNAPDAAYQLGLLLRKAGNLPGAAQAFAAYRALSPDGDFSEDALASQIDAAIEAKEWKLAAHLTEQYAREFPTGDRLEEFRGEIAARAGAAPPAELESDDAALESGSGESRNEADPEAEPGATP